MLGRDWSHSGIAELYSNIKKNNYHILYLTSRPIGSVCRSILLTNTTQANLTRDYIASVKQGEKTLPPGPIFMSPSRLLSSLHQEVLLRRPDEFKIACLKDIQSLFPADSQPFYAGFGNRPTVR
jgi:phosphatidate phosphatase LPIN